LDYLQHKTINEAAKLPKQSKDLIQPSKRTKSIMQSFRIFRLGMGRTASKFVLLHQHPKCTSQSNRIRSNYKSFSQALKRRVIYKFSQSTKIIAKQILPAV